VDKRALGSDRRAQKITVQDRGTIAMLRVADSLGKSRRTRISMSDGGSEQEWLRSRIVTARL